MGGWTARLVRWLMCGEIGYNEGINRMVFNRLGGVGNMRNGYRLCVLLSVMWLSGCVVNQFKLPKDATDPLEEFTLSGSGEEKILMISVTGVISGKEVKEMLSTTPSIVQQVVSRLKKAEKDPRIKMVLFKVDSPGGGVLASDVLYHEILEFKHRTDIPVGVIMMGLAASGGYYISLPSDWIMAHPVTLTGSVGVVFSRPKVKSLMTKVGVDMAIKKSGRNKDMASPFRSETEEESRLMQQMVDQFAGRFVGLVQKHRQLTPEALKTVKTARIFHAEEALKLGLIDGIGYLDDALDKSRETAELSQDVSVIVYRRNQYAEDNMYNDADTQTKPLLSVGWLSSVLGATSGFYYLWPAILP
jgi:protease-4